MQATGPTTLDFSLQDAQPLEKFNSILSQILEHIHSFDQGSQNRFLNQKGLLREAGSVLQVKNVYQKMIADPNQNPLIVVGNSPQKSGEIFLLDPNNVLDLVKKSMKAPETKPLSWPDDIFSRFNNDPSITFHQLEQSLIDANYYEQAKAVHNIMHLCYIIAQNSEKNKMTVNNIDISFSPTVHEFLGTPLLRFAEGINDSSFSQSFEKTHPEIEALMAEDYRKKYPIKVVASTSSGLIATTIASLGSVWTTVTNNTLKAFNATRDYTSTLLTRREKTPAKTVEVGEPQSVTHTAVSPEDLKASATTAKSQPAEESEISADIPPDITPSVTVKSRVQDIETKIESEKKPPPIPSRRQQKMVGNENVSNSGVHATAIAPTTSVPPMSTWRSRFNRAVDATTSFLSAGTKTLGRFASNTISFVGKNISKGWNTVKESWMKRSSAGPKSNEESGSAVPKSNEESGSAVPKSNEESDSTVSKSNEEKFLTSSSKLINESSDFSKKVAVISEKTHNLLLGHQFSVIQDHHFLMVNAIVALKAFASKQPPPDKIAVLADIHKLINDGSYYGRGQVNPIAKSSHRAEIEKMLTALVYAAEQPNSSPQQTAALQEVYSEIEKFQQDITAYQRQRKIELEVLRKMNESNSTYPNRLFIVAEAAHTAIHTGSLTHATSKYLSIFNAVQSFKQFAKTHPDVDGLGSIQQIDKMMRSPELLSSPYKDEIAEMLMTLVDAADREPSQAQQDAVRKIYQEVQKHAQHLETKPEKSKKEETRPHPVTPSNGIYKKAKNTQSKIGVSAEQKSEDARSAPRSKP